MNPAEGEVGVPETAQRRRARLNAVFGEVLPERPCEQEWAAPESGTPKSGTPDRDLRREVPPHHG